MSRKVTTKSGAVMEYDDEPLHIGASLLVGHIRRAYEMTLKTAAEREKESWVRRDQRTKPTPARIKLAEKAAVVAAFQVCTGLTAAQAVKVAKEEASLVGWSHLGISYVDDPEVEYDPTVHNGGPVKVIP